MTILEKIVAAKREEVAELKRREDPGTLIARASANPSVLDFPAALRGARPRQKEAGAPPAPVHIIAEIKRKSPSKGEFPWHGDVGRQATDYEAGGARAISVVTDGPFFGGSAEMLRQVKATVSLPVLQKDFLVDPFQIGYARALGADAVLLIAAVLPGGELDDMIGRAAEAGLNTLVEVFDETEFARAERAGAVVVGVNNRDLRNFSVDHGRTLRLLPLYGEQQVAVAESGFHTHGDITGLLEAGVDAFLIGEALMTAADPARHLRMLRGVPDSSADTA